MINTDILNLLPQDKVVVYEEIGDCSQPNYVERAYYVDHMDLANGAVHVMDEWGHNRKSVSLGDIVDIEKTMDPLVGIPDPEMWDRFGGDPAYKGKHVRILMATIFNRQVNKLVVHLHPYGAAPDGMLSTLNVSIWGLSDHNIKDDRQIIQSMPAYGCNNSRAGYAGTKRDRTYRTAFGRVRKVLHPELRAKSWRMPLDL